MPHFSRMGWIELSTYRELMYSANINAYTRVTFADKCCCSNVFRNAVKDYVFTCIRIYTLQLSILSPSFEGK